MTNISQLLVLGVVILLGPAPWVDAASIEARHGAVAAEHRLASDAGVEMLKKGGNAMDAAVAAALATGVVNPSSSGIGGGGFLVWWGEADKKSTSIDFRESAPKAATETMFVKADGSVDSKASRNGPLAVAVPGELRGFELALKRYGKLKFSDVAAPAIRIAREGFAIEKHLASMIASGRDRLAADPELARVFLHQDGSPRLKGETLKRPELAATLKRLSEVGIDDFYQGEIAADIVRTLAGNGGAPLVAADLASYQPIEREPLRSNYRGRTIVGMAPPSSGGGVMAEILAVLGPYNVAEFDRKAATWEHLLGDTMKAAFADRAVFYGDPAFTPVPIERLISSAHADEIRSKLRASHAVPSAEFAPTAPGPRDAGTSHICVIDKDGNAVSLTTSVNTGFGSGVSVPGRDIVLNNTMDDFAAEPGKPNSFGLVGSKANAIAPGKRPLSSMSPVVVLKDDRAVLVAGASGGPLIITSTLQTLLGVIDFGLSVEAAVAAPRIHHQWMPDVLMVEQDLPPGTQDALKSLGHKLAPLTGQVSVQAIDVSGSGHTRKLHATSDPRKGGVPAGY